MADIKKSTQVAEFELLQKTFKGNNELLVKIRTLLLGFEISEEWKKVIKTTFSNPDVFKAFRKKIFGIYEEDTPNSSIESVNDTFSGATDKISGSSKERIRQELEMRQITIDWLKKGIELLKNPDGEKVDTTYRYDTSDEWGIKLLARNYYIGSIQQGISTLAVMINADIPSMGQMLKKAKKDSTE